MYLHFITLQRQVQDLARQFKGARLSRIYTSRKNELTLVLERENGRFYHVLLSAGPVYPFILVRDPRRRGKNTTDLLPALQNSIIEEMKMADSDRIIHIEFRNSPYSLWLQFFRNHTNFFAADENLKIVDAFKNTSKHKGKVYRNEKQDFVDIENISAQEFKDIIRAQPDAALKQMLRKRFLHVSPLLIREAAFRAELKADCAVSDLTDAELQQLHQVFSLLLQQCRDDKPRVYLEEDSPAFFTLTAFRLFESLPCKIFENINDALAWFIFNRSRSESLRQKKQRINETLDRKISQLEQVIRHLNAIPPESDRRAYFQKVGELLLSQPHSIKKGAEKIQLTDYFDTAQKTLQVRVDPKQTVAENAEIYFQKAKRAVAGQRQRLQRQKDLQNQAAALKKYREQIQSTEQFRDLEKMEKELQQIHVLQTDTDKMESVYRPFKQYFFKNWEIWVGKNARSNDEMTFCSAHKEDLWLHAQGAAGSHVVVRCRNRSADPPRNIIEHAARLAARNSAAKHSSYVPVMVTRVKYVRKPRGSAPGAVVPSREKTIFVEI
ncbi:MAG: NFACT family protein [Calditrichia bacterium]